MIVQANGRSFIFYLAWAFAFIVGLVALVLLFWPIADAIATHDVHGISAPQHDIQMRVALDAARGRLLQVCAGLLALGAFFYTARNYRLAQQQNELSRRTLELSLQGQITDRYTKAIDQIGAGKLEIRIGAIYALGQIARDSPANRYAALDVISAFVRHHTQSADYGRTQPREDITAAMNIISDLNAITDKQDGRRRINLQNARLVGADLSGWHLANVDFSRAILADAQLIDADLSGTLLDAADLSRARLQNANMRGSSLEEAALVEAHLDGCNLQGCALTSAVINQARLVGAALGKANLSRAQLRDADLTGANLADARLPYADLSDAIMTESVLDNADATGANMVGAKLTSASLVDANLTRARLMNADLSTADCTHCCLDEAELFDTVFAGAILRDVHLPGLSHAGLRLDGAITEAGQELPEGWRRDPATQTLSRIDAD